MRKLVLLSAVYVASCQTYDFEPVEPLALQQKTYTKEVKALAGKPNLMLVVDKSGSMKDPIDGSQASCNITCTSGQPGVCGGLCGDCPASCRDRMDDLRTAMDGFLTQNGAIARMGLTLFPNSAVCPSGGTTVIPLAATDGDAAATATQINQRIQTEPPSGGTPTAATLRAVAANAAFADTTRESFVLLLTDGLPNCNDQHPGTNCRCTDSSTSCPNYLCLDEDETVKSVQELRAKKVKTFVVGFGAALTTGAAATVLNRLADEGGMARAGATRYYQASDATQLAGVLKTIIELVGKPCEIDMSADPPQDDRFISVFVDGVAVAKASDTWAYNGTTKVLTFVESGSICTRLKATTTANPINVEVRVAEKL